MKKLIFLSGGASCGKTTALKILIAMLLDLKSPHTVSVIYPQNSARVYALLSAWQNNSKLPDGEFSVVLKIDGIVVGIRTMGDTIGSVWDSVVFFEKHVCDIGVLACHEEHLQRSGNCLTSGWTYEKIKKQKAAASYQADKENKEFAKDLFEKVMDALKQINQSPQAANQKIGTQ